MPLRERRLTNQSDDFEQPQQEKEEEDKEEEEGLQSTYNDPE
jgi:hypothetical protein